MLVGARVLVARWHGDVLAILFACSDDRRVLLAYAPPTFWRSLGEFALDRDVKGFALSRDGGRVAWRVRTSDVEVRDLRRPGPPIFVAHGGRVHNDLKVEVGTGFLTAQAGRHAHVLRWDQGRLELVRVKGSVHRVVPAVFGTDPGRVPVRGFPVKLYGAYDRARFLAVRPLGRGATVAVDQLGQISVFGASGLVCVFFVFRDKVAAWMPDGTRLGPLAFTGGPATPGAAARVGAALRAASNEGRGDGR
jgi:hypothetical protein